MKELEEARTRVDDPELGKCRHCGGEQPLNLHEPPDGCPFCGGAEPLPVALAERLSDLRAAIKQRARREHQIVASQLRLIEDFGLWNACAPPLVAVCMVVPMLFVVSSDLPPEISLFRFLFLESVTDEIAPGKFLVGMWWSFYAIVAYTTASAWLWMCVGAFMRRVYRFTAPLEPGEDGALGCRLCGAPLPRSGAIVRRCDYCGADHLLARAAYRRRARTFERALTDAEKAVSASVSRRNRLGEGLRQGTLGISIFGLITALTTGAWLDEPTRPFWMIATTGGLVAIAPARSLLKRIVSAGAA